MEGLRSWIILLSLSSTSHSLTSASLDGFQQLRPQQDVCVDAAVLAAAVLGAAHVVQPPLLAPRRGQVQRLLGLGGGLRGRVGCRPLPAVGIDLVQRRPVEEGLEQGLLVRG